MKSRKLRRFILVVAALLSAPMAVAMLTGERSELAANLLACIRAKLPDFLVELNVRFGDLSRNRLSSQLSQVVLWLVSPVVLIAGAIASPCAEKLRLRPGVHGLRVCLVNAVIAVAYALVAAFVVVMNVFYPTAGEWILAGIKGFSSVMNVAFGGLSLAFSSIVLRAAADHVLAFCGLISTEERRSIK